jgi:hypothetical protein
MIDLSTCNILAISDWLLSPCLTVPSLLLYAIQRFVASLCSFVAVCHAQIFQVLHDY